MQSTRYSRATRSAAACAAAAGGWRAVFAERLVDAGERATVVNLVREDQEDSRFESPLTPDCSVSFKRITWEALYTGLPAMTSEEAEPLRQ